jgi:GNAT superfamily N-acetyltransferase
MSRYFLYASTNVVASAATNSLLDDQYVVEQLTERDCDEAAALLVAAYAESDDLEPLDLDEVGQFWAGDWGAPIPAATLCVRRIADGAMVSLSLVCEHDVAPLIAHLGTVPDERGRGLSSHLMGRSAEALRILKHDSVSLATAAENRSALKLYAHIGFRFYAPEALEGDAVWYRWPEQFDSVKSMIRSAWGVDGSFALPWFGVGLRHADGSETFSRVNPPGQHGYPGYVLAAVTGHRVGNATYELSPSDLVTAIDLLAAAEASLYYEHPNLAAWRSVRVAARTGDVVIARFADEQWAQA